MQRRAICAHSGSDICSHLNDRQNSNQRNEMTMWPGWLKRLVKRSKTLTALYTKLITKIHWFKDWWGAKIWTRTTEVVTPLGFKLTSSFHPAYQLMRVMKFEVEETTLFTRLLPQMDLF